MVLEREQWPTISMCATWYVERAIQQEPNRSGAHRLYRKGAIPHSLNTLVLFSLKAILTVDFDMKKNI